MGPMADSEPCEDPLGAGPIAARLSIFIDSPV